MHSSSVVNLEPKLPSLMVGLLIQAVRLLSRERFQCRFSDSVY
jgi:hypothetical protein